MRWPASRARTEEAEGSPDGGQPLGPRRQGHPAGGGDFEGREEVTTDRRRFLHLSPTGRGRLRSSRVRGLPAQSDRSVLSIISCTPSRFSYTSVLETRTTKNPQASNTSDRALSLASSDGFGMRYAVDFDDQFSVERHEIDDVPIDRMLAAKFPARQSPIAQRLPKLRLGACLRRAKVSGSRLELVHPPHPAALQPTSPRWGEV